MSKQPYIPLYIGDWEQDTNCLSPLAEFALLKLTFKLFSAEKRGVFYANFRTLSVLFKSDLDQTKEIFKELIDNKILNIGEVEDGKFEIISRRMTREATISEIRAQSGGKGGKAKRKQNGSKRKAKSEQNADIDNEYDINKGTIQVENKGVKIQEVFQYWLDYKKSKKENYKTDQSKGVALKKLIRLSDNNPITALQIIEESIANNWSGFFELKNGHSIPEVEYNSKPKMVY